MVNPQRKSSLSSSSSSNELEEEGKTKKFKRKRFVPKDYKFKFAEETVHVVKTLEKVVKQGENPLPALNNLKFVSEKVSK